MSLLRPQTDHRSVWTKQKQLCPGGGTTGAQTKEDPPPSVETPVLTFSLAWGFPHPYLGSCPLTTISQTAQLFSQWGGVLHGWSTQEV